MDLLSRLDRRMALAAGAMMAGLALVVASTLPAMAQRPVTVPEVPLETLLKQDELPDLVLGAEDAKVTVVEYASLTCGHCMNFHTKVFPELKTKYVDTGKVRWIYRDFPLDPRAIAGAMLARCAAGEEVNTGRALAMIDALFHKQADWAFVKTNPTQALFDVAKQTGFTQERFDKCLTDEALLKKITAIYTRAAETFGVNATPSFFIDGKRLQAAPSVEEFEKALDPLLAGG